MAKHKLVHDLPSRKRQAIVQNVSSNKPVVQLRLPESDSASQHTQTSLALRPRPSSRTSARPPLVANTAPTTNTTEDNERAIKIIMLIRSQLLKLLELPQEILLLVVKSIDSTEDLKNVRLSCKTLGDIAIKPLFGTFVLVPHRDSIARFEEHARSPIAKHLEHLIFDARTLLYDNHYGLWSAGAPDNFKVTKEEIDRFSSSILSFRNLQQFSVQGYEPRSRTPIPTFWNQRIRQTGNRPRMDFFQPSKIVANILCAMQACETKLSRLALGGLNPAMFTYSNVPDDLFKTLGCGLHDLQLEFRYHKWNWHDDEDEHAYRNECTQKHVSNILNSSPRLRRLSIHCNESGHLKHWMMTPAYIVPPIRCPELAYLSISSHTGGMTEFLELLHAMSPSLRSLRLEEIWLLSDRQDEIDEAEEDEDEFRRVCWVRVLEIIRDTMDLQEVGFHGHLHAGRYQGFNLTGNFLNDWGPKWTNPLPVKQEVIEWVLRKRETCELLTNATTNKFYEDRDDLEVVGASWDFAPYWIGDKTWAVDWRQPHWINLPQWDDIVAQMDDEDNAVGGGEGDQGENGEEDEASGEEDEADD